MKKVRFVGLVIFLLIFIISSVSALNGCCEKTVDGEYCIQTNEENCAIDSGFQFVPSSCETTSFCRLGCCYSSDSGRCFQNSPRAACNAIEGATFSDSPECNILQCEKGCCVIGDQAFFVTQVQCKKTASMFPDVEMQFDETVKTERQCVDQTENMDTGCCVKEDGSCVFTTRGSCSSASSEVKGINESLETTVGFHKDMLCSNDKLECDCAKQQTTKCFGEKLFWVDSCGNKENIYSSDKSASYNSGFVLSEEDSCSISGPNDPSCGNCDYASGTVCGEDKEKVMAVGDFTCIGLGCEDVYDDPYSPSSGGDKKNGESWCIYDSQVGLGRDLVGSRFYRHLCIHGEEIVEPCADYRAEICVQGEIGEDVKRNFESFMMVNQEYTEAACRDNRWQDCDSCNTLTQLPGKPEEEDLTKGKTQPDALIDLKMECCNNENVRDCYWMESGITDAGGICVPMVPPGLKHWGSPSATATVNQESAAAAGASTATSNTPAEQTCAKANQDCEVVYRRGGWDSLLKRDKYDIIQNKECTEKDWVIAGNNYCKALGDCGAYYNFLGDATEDGYVNTLVFEDTYIDGSRRELDESDYGDFETMISRPSDDKDSKGDMLIKDPGFWAMVAGFGASGVMGAVGQAGVAGNNSWYSGFGKGLFGGMSSLLSWGKKCNPKTATDKAKKEVAAKQSSSQTKTEEKLPAETATDKKTVGSVVGIDAITGMQTGVPAQQQVPQQFNPFGLFSNFASSKLGKGGQPISQAVQQGLNSNVCGKGFGGKAASIYAGGTAGSIINLAAWGAAIYTTVEYAAQQEKTVTYSIICKPWQAPQGSENCELCNDPMKPCSEYRCKSLGQSCGLVNAGTDEEKCIALDVNDVNSPVVSAAPELMVPYTIDQTTIEGHKGFIINEKIPPFAPVVLGIKADEPAQCKYAYNPGVEFSNMKEYFGSSMYEYNQTLRFAMPAEFASENITSINKGEFTLYVKCVDGNGNANDQDYYVRFNVDDSPDLTPPIIRHTSLNSGSYIGYNETQINLNIYVNEPAECRWSRRDTGFEQMENEFVCETNQYSQSTEYLATYECDTRLVNLTRRDNKFYFKCKDQPWINDDDLRNVNEDSVELILKGTQEPLEIVSVEPEGVLYTRDTEMKVITKGGVENGKAVCAFSDQDISYSNMIVFGETGDLAVSKQPMQGLPEGDYKYYITCMDLGANQDSAVVEFSVDVDEYPPKIVSLYADAWTGSIHIELDEEATCEYMKDENFVFGEGVRFSGEETKFQVTSWEASESAKLRVICVDKFDNKGEYVLNV